MTENDKIKQLFSEKLGQHTVQAPPQVWSGISAGISGAGASSAAGLGLGAKIFIGAAIVAGSIGIGYVLSQGKTADAQPPQAQVQSEAENNFTPTENTNKADKKAEPQELANAQTVAPFQKSEIPTPVENTKSVAHASAPASPNQVKKSDFLPGGMLRGGNKEAEEILPQNKNQNQSNTTANTTQGPTTETEVDVLADFEFVADLQNPLTYTFEATGPADEFYLWDIAGVEKQGKTVTHTFATADAHEIVLNTVSHENTRVLELREDAVCNVPNVFTPGNGDQFNAIFDINHKTSKHIADYTISVLDREQKLLFVSTSTQKFWDGTMKDGTLAPAGVYFYKVSYTDTYGRSDHTGGYVTLN